MVEDKDVTPKTKIVCAQGGCKFRTMLALCNIIELVLMRYVFYWFWFQPYTMLQVWIFSEHAKMFRKSCPEFAAQPGKHLSHRQFLYFFYLSTYKAIAETYLTWPCAEVLCCRLLMLFILLDQSTMLMVTLLPHWQVLTGRVLFTLLSEKIYF